MVRVGWMLLLLVLRVSAQSGEEKDKELPKENPYQSEADVVKGKRLFLGHCAPCHGPEGNGGKGANLARPTLPRAADDVTLYKLIRDGLPGTEMPGAWEMIPHELWQVVAFVRTLGRAAVDEPASGDRFRGEEVFRGKGGCLGCHTVAHEGGRMGPALSDVGYRRSTAFLRKTLLDPQSTIPEGYMYVEIVTKAGKRISGIRLDEDTYTVQLRDLSGHLYSMWKSDLSQLHHDRSHTPMPSVKNKLSDNEVEDLIAYLLSLRGTQ